MDGSQLASVDELHEVVAFLHLEARLLDAGRYRDWLELLTDDVTYVMPSIENRYRRNVSSGTPRLSLFDDTRIDLERRIERLESDTAWTEDPPTRHVHLITNVEAYRREDGFAVHSAFLNYRTRNDDDEMMLIGRRDDDIRRTPAGLRLAQRTIHTSQSLLRARNLNTLL